jgi:serine carboxypeptidase-like clade 2
VTEFFFFPLQLGNPVLDFATDLNSRAEYFWSHGLISDSTYKMFTSACNYSRYVSEYYRDSVSSICSIVMKQVNTETSRFVDKYDVTLDVCVSSVFSQSKFISPKVSLLSKINLLFPLACIIVRCAWKFLLLIFLW